MNLGKSYISKILGAANDTIETLGEVSKIISKINAY